MLLVHACVLYKLHLVKQPSPYVVPGLRHEGKYKTIGTVRYFKRGSFNADSILSWGVGSGGTIHSRVSGGRATPEYIARGINCSGVKGPPTSGTHLLSDRPYTGNTVKSRGWGLFREIAVIIPGPVRVPI